MLVVEHDLALLDMLTDVIHIAYGEPAGFGVVTLPKSVRVGINQYLKGYLPEENIRIRPESIKFEIHPPREDAQFKSMISFNGFSKKFGEGFSLKATGGNLREGEVLGIVGPNGIGKSTFVKVLAGEIKPDEGDPGIEVKISYKPQYIKADTPVSVQDFLRGISKQFGTSYYEVEISNPLQLEKIYDSFLLTSVVENCRGSQLLPAFPRKPTSISLTSQVPTWTLSSVPWSPRSSTVLPKITRKPLWWLIMIFT